VGQRNLRFLCPTKKWIGGGGREITLGSTLEVPEGFAFGSTWHAVGLQAKEKKQLLMIPQSNNVLGAASIRSNSLLDQKGSSSSTSTTTWRRGTRLIRRSLLLCFYVHTQSILPISNFCSTPHTLPRRHRIGRRQHLWAFLCCSSLYVCSLPPAHNSLGGLFTERFWPENYPKQIKNNGQFLYKTQNLKVATIW
jgi:hypothetical protein